MPVSVVCESSANVNAALRESLGGGSCSAAANASVADVDAKDGADGVDCLQSKLVASAKRVLLSKIDYEEVNNYSQSVLETLKSKYIVLKPANGNNNNIASAENGNGRASPATATCSNNNGNGAADANTNGNNTTSKQRPNGSSNNNNNNPNELPQPKRILYPRENVRIGWKNPARKWQVGVGMMNVGNTCYLNSTLQAIFHVPSMANWLMSDTQHMERCESADSSCIICAMAKTLQASQSHTSAIRPYFVYSKLKSICKHLVMGRQEDAHEFLRYLVEAMEKSYVSRFRNYKELDQYSKETTPLNQILGGYLKSAVRCLACSHVSVTFQHFQDLLLDIRKSDSIEDALEGYFSRERLEDMGYKCESCKKKVSATKQFSLERAPITLCIQLKRFSMLGTKINKQITIKPRLDLSKFASRKSSPGELPLTYKLVAMVTHLGASQHCGHYTAIGLTESGTYYNYDDSYVRPISVQNVCNTNAYIIFYEMDNALPRQQQVSSTQVSGAATVDAKENNYQKTNGYSASPQRIIGPQLPPAGLSSYTSTLNANKAPMPNGSPYTNGGSKLSVNRQTAIPTGSSNNNNNANSSKIMIHFKNNNNNSSNINATIKSNASSSSNTTTSTATSSSQNNNNSNINNNTQLQQNGLLMGTGKFQESAHTKSTLASTSNKGQSAAISNGNNESSCSEDEVSSSTQMERKSTAITTTTTTTTTSSTQKAANSLPSMPKLFEHYHNNGNGNAKKSATPLPVTTKSPLKSLVPYESESEDDDAEPKRIKYNATTTINSNSTMSVANRNPLKRRSSLSSSGSTFSSDDEDNYDAGKHSNGSKVKKATTSTAASSLSMSLSSSMHGHSFSKANGNGNGKHRTDPIDDIFNFKRNGFNANTPTKKQQQKSQSQQFFVSSTTPTTDSDNDDDAAAYNSRPTYNRSHSTPPSPPVIKTKTGLWQVTALQPETEQKPKNNKNPFATKTPTTPTNTEMLAKRAKLNSSVKRTGNGYQHDVAESDSAVSELLKQSHRGYGAPVLTWNGEQTDIDKEIEAEAREQRQRDWEEEDDDEMDRGRQKKVKAHKDPHANNNSTPGYNPFQEQQENQRRWRHGGGGGGGGVQRYHSGHFRNQFQRNKFKFQRYNQKYQRTHQRNGNGGGGGGGAYNRRDS